MERYRKEKKCDDDVVMQLAARMEALLQHADIPPDDSNTEKHIYKTRRERGATYASTSKNS